MENEELTNLLLCPVNQDSLFRTESGFLSASGIVYAEANGLPILIDFDKSLIDKERVQVNDPLIKRHKYFGLKSMLKNIISPKSSLTVANVEYLIGSLTSKGPRVLVVGGGSIGQGLERLYASPEIEIVSFDVYVSENIDFIADAHDIPLISGSFDLVIVQAVLEHVLKPDRVVSEIYRVLKEDGIVYSETPFLQQVHEGPFDFTRFTDSGHRYLFRRFSLLKSGALQGAGSQMLWTIDNFFRGVFRSRLIGKFFKFLFFWVRFFDRIIPESYNVDSACGVYFIGRKSSKVICDRDIISYYKGAQ